MTTSKTFLISFSRLLLLATVASAGVGAGWGASILPAPKAGDLAPNFTLETLAGHTVDLKSLVQERPVVLVVLRGWPGYQCPLCARQVQDYVASAAAFEQHKATVVMVYPGPAPQLIEHATEFLQEKSWPGNFILVLDPDYSFTNAYGLRWDAKKETAYPSTFILERGGRIGFAHVSQSHGNRLSAARALAELK
jgi:thioredoxin-dependent peroxiredoxin